MATLKDCPKSIEDVSDIVSIIVILKAGGGRHFYRSHHYEVKDGFLHMLIWQDEYSQDSEMCHYVPSEIHINLESVLSWEVKL